MKKQLLRCLVWGFSTFCWALLSMFLGCQTVPERAAAQLESVPAEVREVLEASLEANGGVEGWANTGQYDAVALTTLPEEGNGRSLLEQHYSLRGGVNPSLTVVSIEPRGDFRETLRGNGEVQISGGGADAALLRGSAMKLRLIMQALMGPGGLLMREDWELSYMGTERQAGRLVHKIAVTGPMVPGLDGEMVDEQSDRLLVWIDAQSKRISRMWLCPTGQNGCMTVSLRDFQRLDSGLMVPGIVELAPSDRAEDFNEEPMMIVEFRETTVELAD